MCKLMFRVLSCPEATESSDLRRLRPHLIFSKCTGIRFPSESKFTLTETANACSIVMYYVKGEGKTKKQGPRSTFLSGWGGGED